jgi:pyruvate/2-oxoglutarate/acetoin dehydrogenase E1 component
VKISRTSGISIEGIDCEVIDLRVLCPLDFESVAASVAKTGRCLIAHEDYPEYAVAAELAARLAGELFADLDAPIGRVGAHFWPIPFSPPLEQATLPDRDRIIEEVRRLAQF